MHDGQQFYLIDFDDFVHGQKIDHQIPNKRKSVVESVLKTDNDIETVDKDVPSPSANKKRKRQNSEEEEEKWLDAVESGNLAQVDAELKTIRDPKLMTARQRAMVDRKNKSIIL